jgi:hypothetical protein
VQLNNLLDAFDRTAANLAKLEKIWDRAQTFIPKGPAAGSPPEYDDLCRSWSDLLKGLPEIDGWTITAPLPDIDSLGRAFIDYLEADQIAFELFEQGEQPGKDLDEYRYRLNRARRQAARGRLQALIVRIDTGLPHVLAGVDRDSRLRLEGEWVDRITTAIPEIERLMGDTAQRTGRWTYLLRHIHFGEGHDWHDIAEFDWPSVRSDIEAAGLSDIDPLPTPDIDLGHAATGTLTGSVSTVLLWSRLTDDGFERLLYDLLREYPEHQNVQWLTKTRAADRGRDLSFDRVLQDATGGSRIERVIVPAKHWQAKSIRPTDLAEALAGVKLWEPPAVHTLIVVTSGRFTSDAIAWQERHNYTVTPPHIDLWPENKLESLLAQKPHIAAAHGLR